jgi:hypothetical protein
MIQARFALRLNSTGYTEIRKRGARSRNMDGTVSTRSAHSIPQIRALPRERADSADRFCRIRAEGGLLPRRDLDAMDSAPASCRIRVRQVALARAREAAPSQGHAFAETAALLVLPRKYSKNKCRPSGRTRTTTWDGRTTNDHRAHRRSAGARRPARCSASPLRRRCAEDCRTTILIHTDVDLSLGVFQRTPPEQGDHFTCH